MQHAYWRDFDYYIFEVDAGQKIWPVAPRSNEVIHNKKITDWEISVKIGGVELRERSGKLNLLPLTPPPSPWHYINQQPGTVPSDLCPKLLNFSEKKIPGNKSHISVLSLLTIKFLAKLHNKNF